MIKELFATLQAAEATTRYSRDYISTEENVLLHTGWVASFCFLLAKKIEKDIGIKIDYSILLQKAIIHDFDEVGTGDIPRITKYANQETLNNIKKIEEISIIKLQEFLDIDILEIWKNSKDQTLEGDIVKLADICAVVYKIWLEIINKNNLLLYRVCLELEIILGNKNSYNSLFSGIIEELKKIVDSANTICREREFIFPLDVKIGDII